MSVKNWQGKLRMAKRQADYSGIRPDAKNANKGTERGRYMVEASLRETGAGRSILLDKDGRIIAGNKTFEAASDIGLPVRIVQTDGSELVAVQRTDLDLDDDTGTARKMAYYDNRAAQVGLDWSAEQLFEDLAVGLDLSAMFRQDELDALIATISAPDEVASTTQEQARATLAERFLVPPFSVLDARQGYWQARKSAWIALGIQSELGRGEGVHQYSDAATIKRSGGSIGMDGSKVYAAKNAAPRGSPRDAASLKNGRTVRGDGTGKPLARGGGKHGTPQRPDATQGEI
jgi:hypothetical protein